MRLIFTSVGLRLGGAIHQHFLSPLRQQYGHKTLFPPVSAQTLPQIKTRVKQLFICVSDIKADK